MKYTIYWTHITRKSLEKGISVIIADDINKVEQRFFASRPKLIAVGYKIDYIMEEA